jgi:hypothetical protein
MLGYNCLCARNEGGNVIITCLIVTFCPERKKSRSINTFYMQDMYLCAEIWYAKENEW